MSVGSISITLIIAIIILIIALIYASIAATAITNISTDYTSDKDLVQAHSYLTWISVVGWLAVVGIIIGVIVLFTEGDELFATNAGSTILALILFISVALIIAVGVLTSLAAESIGNSNLFKKSSLDPNLVKARSDSIIAAVASLGTLTFVLVGAGIYYYSSGPKQQNYSTQRPPPNYSSQQAPQQQRPQQQNTRYENPSPQQPRYRPPPQNARYEHPPPRQQYVRR